MIMLFYIFKALGHKTPNKKHILCDFFPVFYFDILLNLKLFCVCLIHPLSKKLSNRKTRKIHINTHLRCNILISLYLSGPRNYGKSIEWKLEGDPWVSEGLYSDSTRGIYLLCLILQVGTQEGRTREKIISSFLAQFLGSFLYDLFE